MKNNTSDIKKAGASRLLVLCLLVLLHGCAKEDPEHYVQEGKSLVEKGDLEGARVQFKNAIQIDPKRAAAYYEIALLDEKKQDWKGMFGNLLETVSIDPSHLDANIKLGQFYLLSGQTDKAMEQAKQALQLAPDHAGASLLDASVKFRMNNKNEALQVVNAVLARDPKLADAIGLKASILAADKNYSDAISVLLPGIEHDPGNIGLRILKIRLQIDSKDFDAAIRDYEALLAQHPEDADLRTSYVNLLSQLGRLDLAETTLRDFIKSFPDNIDFKLKFFDLMARRNVDEAEKSLKQFIAELPKDARLKFRLADFYIARQRYDDAETTLEVLVREDAKGKDGLAAKVKLAEIAAARKDTTKLATLTEDVLSIDANNSDALLLRAGLRIDRKDADGAISDLRIVLRDRPNSEHALLLMAQASLQKGETEIAESQWRKVLEMNPGNMGAVVPLANHLMKRGDSTRAEELLNKAAKALPKNPAPLEMLIQVMAAKKDWEGARAALERLESMPQAPLSAKYWEGFLAASAGNMNAAVKHYQDLLAVKPDHLQTLAALTQIHESNGNRAELITYLKAFTASHPQISQARDILVSAHIAERQWDQAEKILRASIDKAPDDTNLKLRLVNVIEPQSESRAESTLKEFVNSHPKEPRLKFRLAGFYAGRKLHADATALLKEIVAANPGGKEASEARLKMAELALSQNELSTAESALAEILGQEPEHVDALMMRASLRVAEKNYPAALDDLAAVLKTRPDFDRASLMTAQVHLLQGATDKAEESWRKILQTQPGNLAALGPLTGQLIKRAAWTQAEEAVSAAIKSAPGNAQVHELQIQLRLARKDWAGAEEAITELKKLPKIDQAAKLWSATLATAQGQHEAAIALYKEALANKPDAPDVLSALSQAYLAAGKADEQAAYFKSFVQKNPNVDAAHDALAMSYMALKKWSDAEKVLLNKLKRNPKSVSTYKLIARVYAEQEKHNDVVSIYEKGLAELPDHPILKMELAKFHDLKKDYEKSIQIYDEVIAKYPDNLEAVNNLAYLLVSVKGDRDSLERAKGLVTHFKDSRNPLFLDTYAWYLVKSGQVEQALPILKKIVDTLPNDPVARYHLGEALLKSGERNAAKSELEKAVSIAKEQGAFFGMEQAKEMLDQLRDPG
jgi:tetratricopeptide (TPR) repeat protein